MGDAMNTWTLDTLRQTAADVGALTTADLLHRVPAAYKAACRRGLLYRLGLSRTKRYSRLDLEALLSRLGGITRGELKKENPSLYAAARRNGWLVAVPRLKEWKR